MIRNKVLLEVNSELVSLYPKSGAAIIHEYVEESGEPEEGPGIEEVELPGDLKKALEKAGLKRLYKFQYEAFEYIRSGFHTVIVAGTGTGKTEGFLIPILADLYSNPTPLPRAVVTYPTKALSRDQLSRFYKYMTFGKVSAGIYDGDTPSEARRRMRLNPPSILITNPDMIHVGLARSSGVRMFVEKAKFFVVDELHVYEGVLGTHLKYILDRVKLTRGGTPQFIASSATLSNPKEFAESILGVDVAVVKGPNRRRGVAVHALVSTGYLSRWTITAALSSILARMGLKHIIFVDSQQMAELVARISSRSFGNNVLVHRAGLPPEERRSVEEKLKRGEILAVASTPTLELGIDIGDLDAVVMASPPPSYTKYLQRAGRAGRRGRVGFVFTILGDDPIDSYYERYPQQFFNQETPPSVIEPANIEVGKIHLLAHLLESRRARISDLPPVWRRALDLLVEQGAAYVRGNYAYPRRALALRILEEYGSIRSGGPQVEILEEDGRVIGYRELPQAILDLYPGAIYLSQTKPYISLGVDVEGRRAYVKRLEGEVDYYTKPLYTVDVLDYNVLDERVTARGIPLVYADVQLEISVEGYVVRNVFDEKSGGKYWFDSPIKYSYPTKAVLIKYPELDEFSRLDHAEAFHAIEHALISAARLVCGAGLTDMGGVSYPSGDIVVYDAAPGGSGLARLLFERFERAEDVALDIVSKCDCEDGCPRCIYSPYCGNNNQVLSRRKASYVLRLVIEEKAREKARPLENKKGRPLA